MNEREIDKILSTIREKTIGNQLLEDDVAMLLTINTNHPCNLRAALVLLELAWSWPKMGFKHWTEHYHEVLARKDKCWTDADMSRIHSMGSYLYGNDDNRRSEIEEIRKAYHYAPNDWEIIHEYIWGLRTQLEEAEAVRLAERLTQLAPDNAMAYYALAGHFEDLWRRYKKQSYLENAISGFEKAVELGLDDPHINLGWLTRKIIELKSKLKSL